MYLLFGTDPNIRDVTRHSFLPSSEEVAPERLAQVPPGRSGCLAEGEVDPLTLMLIGLFDAVNPVFLGVSGHHEE